MVLLHCLLLFVLRHTQALELFPKQLAQCMEAQLPLGSKQRAPVRMSMVRHAEQENRVVFFQWLVWESSSALLYTLRCL